MPRQLLVFSLSDYLIHVGKITLQLYLYGDKCTKISILLGENEKTLRGGDGWADDDNGIELILLEIKRKYVFKGERNLKRHCALKLRLCLSYGYDLIMHLYY